MTDTIQVPDASSAVEIAFGFNRETDEKSLKIFITRFADNELLSSLLPRMNDTEILAVLNLLSSLMKKHLTEKEYHRLFMADR